MIAKALGISRRHIYRCLEDMVNVGLLPGKCDAGVTECDVEVTVTRASQCDVEVTCDAEVTPEPAEECDVEVTECDVEVTECDAGVTDPEGTHGFVHGSKSLKALRDSRNKEHSKHGYSSGEPDLSLRPTNAVNRWLQQFMNHRPGAGHPLRNLEAPDVADARLRIESFIETVGEERASEILSKLFGQSDRPSTVKQALFFADKLIKTEAQEDEAPDDRQQYRHRVNLFEERGWTVPDDLRLHAEEEEKKYGSKGRDVPCDD